MGGKPGISRILTSTAKKSEQKENLVKYNRRKKAKGKASSKRVMISKVKFHNMVSQHTPFQYNIAKMYPA